MESMVPPESEWNAVEQDFEVWDLGDAASPAYAMIVPGWVRLALASADADTPPDWETAKERLEDVLSQGAPPPDGWTVVPVLEHESEVIEIGPNAPPMTSQASNGRRDAQVWRVNCQGEMAAWLIAYKDTYDATLVLPGSRAANSAWRSVARQVASQTLLKELPARSRWRLAIVGEERQPEYHFDPQTVVDGAVAASAAAAAAATSQAPTEDRWALLLARIRRAPLLTVLIVLVVCVALSFIIGQIRRPGGIVPALSVPGASNPAIKTGAQVMVVSPQMVPVHRNPGNNTEVLMLTAAGQVVDVTGGPESADNQIWWQVKINSVTGWLPEKLQSGVPVLGIVPK
ncbi:MAG: hypothetical protein U0822_03560 [Anaerolineae bacterium]